MANSTQDADAAFFGLMHSYLKPQAEEEEDAGEERRNRYRRAFQVKQRIAPGYCWEVPPDTAWIEVMCYDLTQGGFSFFLDEKPDFERLVAMFRPSEPIFVAAGINYWRPVLVDEWGGVLDPVAASTRPATADYAPASKFLVGCQFLRRFSR